VVAWARHIGLSIDFSALLRRLKPEKQLAQLRHRPLSTLPAAQDVPPGRLTFVPDTNVYILDASGNLPPAAAMLVDNGVLVHCSVCLGELAVGVANYSPNAPDWRYVRDHYAALISAVPEHRLLEPDAEIWATAGLIAGTLARTQGFQPHNRKEVLNDALIYLTATKKGLPVLTANRNEFDLVQQLAAVGSFIHF
jgi:predicted nucleic acid-binding protein